MTESPAQPTPVLEQPRLVSLDALRGFDMFWIIGGDTFMTALGQMSDNPVLKALSANLDHVDWEAFRFYDLIFPLFVFLVGVSVVFSLDKVLEREGRSVAVSRVLRRFTLLFLVALLYSGGFSKEWPDIRLLGVLNR